MHKELLVFFHKIFNLTPTDLTYGNSLKGSDRLFDALISLFNAKFNPIFPVLKENLVTGAG
jgi:1-aminocyclopropane-1-carboxylate synthase